MKIIKLRIISLYLLCLLILVTSNLQIAIAETPKRIAVLPFKINAEKDLSFLRDGIYDMLSTRLYKEGQAEVLSRASVEEAMQSVAGDGAVTETSARSIGNNLNADFVLFGSLTVLGDNVSIDAKMIDITGGKPTMTFFDQSQDLGAVITKINLIAADINAKMFGQTAVAAKQPAQAAQPAQAETPPKKTEKTGIHAHPEKLLKEDGFITETRPEDAGSPFVMQGVARGSQQKFWKSANFKHLLNGVALGDVDGDGKIETVAITPDKVMIYRSEAGRFRKLQELSEGGKNQTSVDVADINQNGTSEIFVTSLNAGKNVLVSFVLEYDGKNFIKIIEDSHWYYRVVDTPARGRILLGQRPRIYQPFSGTIYEMKWENGDYVPGDEIKSPRNTNLLGLTVGDVMNNGQEIAVAYKPNDHIRVFDSSGNVMWEGSDRLGGSMLYTVKREQDREEKIEDKMYLPMRLLVWKNTNKNESEVITVNNHDATNYKTEYRYLNKTHIESLSWDGVGLGPNWKTRRISGYIQDITIGDFDNDGQDELVAALVMKEGKVILLGEPKSTIIAYELTMVQKPES